MGIRLYAHNQEAYKNAMTMLLEKGKAAVVHPTGTGKSFIGFKLAEEHRQERICWLAPSEYIYRTQIENLKVSGGEQPENILFYTYARLMMMDQEEIEQIRPAYIILDEFHRCGALKWGEGVQRLLAVYPEVPVLGLSATHIRYLDNQRDMADELFEGNVASEMTLGEAIVRGILKAPKYVLSVYAYQKDLKKFEKKIRDARTKAVRDEAQRYLEALRRALDKADGLNEIFEKHMPDRQGKYIVFCANVEHMYEMIDHVPDWFRGIDDTPHIYSAYAENPETDKAFAKFKTDNSDHLKLLFCVDMLNEGIHVEGVSGVILLRPTVSPIIYKQQIGRAFSAGSKNDCVIFDVAMNIENLYSIGTIEEEMQEAIAYYRFTNQPQLIVNERFRIYDELQDCRMLFDRLNETLGASWETMYQAAKRYYEAHGDLKVPRRYKTEEAYALGDWVFAQRKVRAGLRHGVLTDSQIAKLDEIGMIWEGMKDFSWNSNFSEAQKWFEEKGNLNVAADTVTESGFRLGSWISNLRVYRKYGVSTSYLTEERIQALNHIGMIWDTSDFLWERNYAAARQYYEEHGNLDVPAAFRTEEGICLGSWIRNLRNARTGKGSLDLSEKQIEALDRIGMQWEAVFARKWDAAYEEAAAYYAEHDDLKVPVKYVTKNGLRLGRWIRRQRDAKESLSRLQIEKLDAIGMIWEKQDSWEAGYQAARKYFEKNGDLRVPHDLVLDGVWLQKWLNEQKQIYLGKRQGKSLSKAQIKQLEEVGMTWQSSAEIAWEEQYENAVFFYKKYGHLQVPKGYRGTSGKKLDSWIMVQRRKYRNGELTTKQIEMLDALQKNRR